MSEPKPGWTLDVALDQLAQGYTVTRTAERSGFHPAHLRAAAGARGIPLSD